MASHTPSRRLLTTQDYVDGVLAGDRAMLARAITLIESRKAAHQAQAQEVLQALLPHAGRAHRVGITGVPGVGKSTLIEALGSTLTAAGHRLAVLAIDPTSSRTGGSILGDKTRMGRLAADERAFIRPSPASGTLGGVARKTRETMLLTEAAGYDVVFVETVGIGQSEITVADMVDFFLVLMLPGAGDELQGLKKGVLEIADMIAVNKADGDNVDRARRAAAEYKAAFHILTPASPNWSPPVICVSGQENTGLDVLWGHVVDHRDRLTATGELDARRRDQQVRWMWAMIEDRLMGALRGNAAVAGRLPGIEAAVAEGRMTATLAVDEIAALMGL
jgi:LAO/AO transport system kinase